MGVASTYYSNYPPTPAQDRHMNAEQFFPTRWVLNGMTRTALASHLRQLRKIDLTLARKCVSHAHWVGVYPVRVPRGWASVTA